MSEFEQIANDVCNLRKEERQELIKANNENVDATGKGNYRCTECGKMLIDTDYEDISGDEELATEPMCWNCFDFAAKQAETNHNLVSQNRFEDALRDAKQNSALMSNDTIKRHIEGLCKYLGL